MSESDDDSESDPVVKITIELISAKTGEKRHLGTAIIANTGTSEDRINYGNYTIKLMDFRNRKIWRQGNITGFPRQRLGAWDLLYRGLQACIGSRNRNV